MRNPTDGTLPLQGQIGVPGDKSISHRALILAALAEGRSLIGGMNVGADVRATGDLLAALGCGITWDLSKCQVEVLGRGWAGLQEPEDVLDARNSGTTLRSMLGICATIPGLIVLTGDASLRRRPMLRVVAPLRRMGALIDGRSDGELAPLSVRGGRLRAIEHDSTVASAQVKTAVLLAGLRAEGVTSVKEPALSRDHTERMLAASGVKVERSPSTVWVAGGQQPEPGDRQVPGDLSSAAFLLVAAALVPGSRLCVTDLGLNPTRTGLLDVLALMGASVEVQHQGEDGGEPIGRVSMRTSKLRGVVVDAGWVPRLIDEAPVLAVAATQAEGTTVIRGAGELRIKESDRIDAMVEGLRVLGADVEALADGLRITGPTRLEGGEVDSRGDHRVALAFSVAALIARGEVRINGWSCVQTSFPEFAEVLAKARGVR